MSGGLLRITDGSQVLSDFWCSRVGIGIGGGDLLGVAS